MERDQRTAFNLNIPRIQAPYVGDGFKFRVISKCVYLKRAYDGLAILPRLLCQAPDLVGTDRRVLIRARWFGYSTGRHGLGSGREDFVRRRAVSGQVVVASCKTAMAMAIEV